MNALLDADHFKDCDDLLVLLRQLLRKHAFNAGKQKLRNVVPERTEFHQTSLVMGGVN